MVPPVPEITSNCSPAQAPTIIIPILVIHCSAASHAWIDWYHVRGVTCSF